MLPECTKLVNFFHQAVSSLSELPIRELETLLQKRLEIGPLRSKRWPQQSYRDIHYSRALVFVKEEAKKNHNLINFSEAERKTGKSVKTRLNDALQKRLEEVEKKREKMIILDKKIAKLGEGPEKRKLVYQKQTQDNYNRKHKKAPIDEERAAHESYQILLKVKKKEKSLH